MQVVGNGDDEVIEGDNAIKLDKLVDSYQVALSINLDVIFHFLTKLKMHKIFVSIL
jgi:hypothetical protein